MTTFCVWALPLQAIHFQETRAALPTDALKLWLTTPENGISLNSLTAQRPKIGDFVVYSYRRTFSLICLVRFENRLCIEEACISKSAFQKLKLTWPEWQRRHFPKALYHFRLQWPLSAANRENPPRILRLSPKGKRPVMPHLLSAIWTLPFQPQVHLGTETPSLPTLSFSLVIEGEPVENATVQAFSGKWPEDQSLLSGKPILLYFATLPADTGSEVTNRAPLYWPIILQVGSGNKQEKLSAVDFGTLGA